MTCTDFTYDWSRGIVCPHLYPDRGLSKWCWSGNLIHWFPWGITSLQKCYDLQKANNIKHLFNASHIIGVIIIIRHRQNLCRLCLKRDPSDPNRLLPMQRLWVVILKPSQLRGDFRKKPRRFKDILQICEGGQAQTRNSKWF